MIIMQRAYTVIDACESWRVCCAVVACAGPLVAAVEAQASAAMTTLSYMQSVGFTANGTVINTQFRYVGMAVCVCLIV